MTDTPAAEKPAASAIKRKPAPASTKLTPRLPTDKAAVAAPASTTAAPAPAAAPKSEARPAKSSKAAKPEKAPKAPKVEKPKKPKLVRDSFTMPEDEYAQLAALKKRLLGQGVAAKKSEILRAGLAMLAGQGDEALGACLQAVPPIKTGRPAK